jgi:hypothetical protein
MLERIRDTITGTDALIRAMRGSDPQKFVEVFERSTVLFLQLPPGCENGLGPDLSKVELLAHIRAGAKDLSQRKQFTPLRFERAGRESLLLFTQQALVQEFAHSYVREIRRIMAFEVLGVKGKTIVPCFEGVHSVVFNARTKHEHELPGEDLDGLRRLLIQPREEHPGQQ